ncbi:Uncharacterized membrane protein [Arsukibacterium tuosuense]|uniref:Uncharacterized membrane protein n=1 Tax=Arsukibacterium tuosuense TaxID=1323745 RepID=A0A285IC89_9GAMM|nr:DUF2254 domain-containing protein [Arsukibacterium tuosuense]SNY45624.1 Uncharacterized membrane protein [Arsukibacterium tuosuense]
MLTKWGWQLLQLSRKLWVRTSLFTLLAFFTPGLGVLLSGFIPDSLGGTIGSDAAEKILTILATSMLTVTTFSLSVMVAAFNAASTGVSPRATRLLMADSTTQNALATFVGSFLYSIVGIVLLSADVYGETGRVVLFIMTIGIILLIVVTILIWIEHLSGLGRVGETANRVEDEAYRAVKRCEHHPWLDANQLNDLADIPNDAKAVCTSEIGYIQHIDIKALNDWATEHNTRVYISSLPGTFVHKDQPLMWLSGGNAAPDKKLFDAFYLSDFRSFDQDPRFGVIVLAEIASKALSPGINDPGTAIEIIGRGVRVLSNWPPENCQTEVKYSRVWAPEVKLDELFDDFFTSIARDGAANIEVQIRLQKAFLALAGYGAAFKRCARAHAAAALARAELAISYQPDIDLLQQLNKQLT